MYILLQETVYANCVSRTSMPRTMYATRNEAAMEADLAAR
jgi:hypothetical protein